MIIVKKFIKNFIKNSKLSVLTLLISPIKYDNDERYPLWGEILGWCLALSSMLCVPIVALLQIAKEKGTLQERINNLLMPKVIKQLRRNQKFNN